MAISEIQQTILTQINHKHLVYFEGCKIGIEGENIIHVRLGRKRKLIVIEYDRGMDTYNLREIKFKGQFEIAQDKKTKDVYCDELVNVINNFFEINTPEIKFISTIEE